MEGVNKEAHILGEFLTLNSRKCKLVYGVRKQISACLGLRTTVGGLQRVWGTCWWWWIYSLSLLLWRFHGYAHMSRFIQFYVLHMFSLLHFNYTSIKFFKKELFSSVVYDCLQPHGLQHTRPPCPSLSPGVCSDSCPLNQWCHPTISFSVIPFAFLPSVFPSIRVFSNELALCIR